MAEFRDIIGQEQLKEHLQGAIERNKVSHAYIINGERNSGKEFIAKVLQWHWNVRTGRAENPVRYVIPANRH